MRNAVRELHRGLQVAGCVVLQMRARLVTDVTGMAMRSCGCGCRRRRVDGVADATRQGDVT
jgi:hypothetical protein